MEAENHLSEGLLLNSAEREQLLHKKANNTQLLVLKLQVNGDGILLGMDDNGLLGFDLLVGAGNTGGLIVIRSTLGKCSQLHQLVRSQPTVGRGNDVLVQRAARPIAGLPLGKGCNSQEHSTEVAASELSGCMFLLVVGGHIVIVNIKVILETFHNAKEVPHVGGGATRALLQDKHPRDGRVGSQPLWVKGFNSSSGSSESRGIITFSRGGRGSGDGDRETRLGHGGSRG